jgi:GT2 family glycosyltransferase
VRQAVSPERFRILVVDNGSGDDSLARLARDLPEAEVIALPENRGFAAAVNAGLERVTEPYAFILNTDITLENDAFTLLIKALTQDPRAALACPLLLRLGSGLGRAGAPTVVGTAEPRPPPTLHPPRPR